MLAHKPIQGVTSLVVTLLHFLNGLLENSLCTLGCLGDILHEDVEEPSNEDFQLTPDTGEDDQGEHKYNRYRSNHNAHYCAPSLPATPFANSKS